MTGDVLASSSTVLRVDAGGGKKGEGKSRQDDGRALEVSEGWLEGWEGRSTKITA